VYLLKRLEKSGTPVFYNGMRVGKDGRLFPCWKFCTMRTDGDQILAELLDTDAEARREWELYQKLRNDPRIDSRISAFLRKTSLDELPQLWNVFIGDMSLVGPRPILPYQTTEYGDSLRHYTSVRPGLTGLWQVSGRNETTFAQRINWDGWYIRNWSVWNDVIILFKTVRVLFTGSGAY
jgi:undecaprenyl-phosphate galactose phosphotransferase